MRMLCFVTLLAKAKEEEAAGTGTTARGTTGAAETTPTGNRIRNVQRNRKNVVVVVELLEWGDGNLRGCDVLGDIQWLHCETTAAVGSYNY